MNYKCVKPTCEQLKKQLNYDYIDVEYYIRCPKSQCNNTKISKLNYCEFIGSEKLEGVELNNSTAVRYYYVDEYEYNEMLKDVNNHYISFNELYGDNANKHSKILLIVVSSNVEYIKKGD